MLSELVSSNMIFHMKAMALGMSIIASILFIVALGFIFLTKFPRAFYPTLYVFLFSLLAWLLGMGLLEHFDKRGMM